MATIAQILNKYLQALYDVDDNIYQAVIANVEGVANPTISDPSDFNAGAITNTLEWIRQLTLCLLEQLDLNLAQGKFLDFIVHDHLNIVRFEGELDVDYIQRVVDYIIAVKVSRAAIIYYMRPYSTPGEPQLLDGVDDAAFADVSFSDVYTTFQNTQPGPEFDYWVFPAITSSIGASAYFFILRLENTPDTEIAEVVDYLNRWIAGGILYEIQIVAV